MKTLPQLIDEYGIAQRQLGEAMEMARAYEGDVYEKTLLKDANKAQKRANAARSAVWKMLGHQITWES